MAPWILRISVLASFASSGLGSSLLSRLPRGRFARSNKKIGIGASTATFDPELMYSQLRKETMRTQFIHSAKKTRLRYQIALTALTLLLGNGSIVGAAQIGPVPYLAFDPNNPNAERSDSPFADIEFSSFYFENFESDAVIPQLIMESGIRSTAFGSTNDSVDGDDGQVDGSGVNGSAWFDENLISFQIDQNEVDELPTHLGLVITDSSLGGADMTLTAFDSNNEVVEAFTFFFEGDDSFAGTTDEDRFVGIIHEGGIARIELHDNEAPNGFEIDHIYFGTPGSTLPDGDGIAVSDWYPYILTENTIATIYGRGFGEDPHDLCVTFVTDSSVITADVLEVQDNRLVVQVGYVPAHATGAQLKIVTGDGGTVAIDPTLLNGATLTQPVLVWNSTPSSRVVTFPSTPTGVSYTFIPSSGFPASSCQSIVPENLDGDLALCLPLPENCPPNTQVRVEGHVAYSHQNIDQNADFDVAVEFNTGDTDAEKCWQTLCSIVLDALTKKGHTGFLCSITKVPRGYSLCLTRPNLHPDSNLELCTITPLRLVESKPGPETNDLTLTFSGQLYASDTVNGPYTLQDEARSPYVVNTQTGSESGFYLAQADPTPAADRPYAAAYALLNAVAQVSPLHTFNAAEGRDLFVINGPTALERYNFNEMAESISEFGYLMEIMRNEESRILVAQSVVSAQDNSLTADLIYVDLPDDPSGERPEAFRNVPGVVIPMRNGTFPEEQCQWVFSGYQFGTDASCFCYGAFECFGFLFFDCWFCPSGDSIHAIDTQFGLKKPIFDDPTPVLDRPLDESLIPDPVLPARPPTLP